MIITWKTLNELVFSKYSPTNIIWLVKERNNDERVNENVREKYDDR